MDTWLTSLITKTPQEGYVQPAPEVKKKLRAVYAENADSLTFASK